MNRWRAAVVAGVTALVGALGLGYNGQVVAGGASERVRALEVRADNLEKWLERIDGKIDKLLKREGE